MAAAEATAQGPNWYETTAVERRDGRPLSFDLDVDACVIGGGLAGLTTARELARRGWSVAVLEADRIGSAASGRNCGFVLPGFGETIAQIAERVGLARAHDMWAHAEAGRAYVRETVTETGMPGVDPVDGWLRVAKFAEDPTLDGEASLLRDTFGAAVELWPAERVRACLRSPLYCNAIHYRSGFHIHPLNYALGLAAAAEREGVRIFESTPAVSIDPAGVRKRIATPAARVRATQIVLAGNVQVGSVAPRLSSTLIPITTFLAVTAPIGARLDEAILYRGGVSDGAWADNHYRVVGGDRLLWSGGMRTWNADPQRFARRLRADIRRTFPQLRSVEIEHVWSGTLGRTVHKMPQIGELTPGMWVASGFGGHGLNTTAMAGLLLARAIAEGDTSWQVFEAYELVWAGGTVGRSLVQIGYAGYRARERTRARWARWGAAVWRRGNSAGSASQVSEPPALPQAEVEAEPDVAGGNKPRGRGRVRQERAATPAAPAADGAV
jgi:glycine/D-amino acid oxidase-like deaminating enzyme